MHLIVGIDGTLFDNTQRQHLIPEDVSRTENWIAFNNTCLDDEPMIDVINNIDRLMSIPDTKVTFLTSRGESARVNTAKQLRKYLNTMYTRLEMRPMDYHLPPVEFKKQWLENNYKGELALLFDDHPDIINMVRQNFPTIIPVEIPTKCVTV